MPPAKIDLSNLATPPGAAEAARGKIADAVRHATAENKDIEDMRGKAAGALLRHIHERLLWLSAAGRDKDNEDAAAETMTDREMVLLATALADFGDLICAAMGHKTTPLQHYISEVNLQKRQRANPLRRAEGDEGNE